MRSLGSADHRRHSKREAAFALTLASCALAASCAVRPATPTEPLGRIPEIVTKAEPEWLPFAIRAGARSPDDPRERHLRELRDLAVDADVARARWAPDGTHLVLEARAAADARQQIYVLDLGTGTLARASNPSLEAKAPSFTWPAGDRVLFTEGALGARRIVSAKLDGSDLREEIGSDAAFGAPLEDGAGIVFVRAEGNGADLFAKALSGDPAPRALFREPRFEEEDLAASPDRTRIAWIGRSKDAQILFDARISSPTEPARAVEALSTALESIAAPAFLPDSHRLAFASDRDAAAGDIYVVDLDERFGPGAPPRSVRVTFADGGSGAPAFSPDGRHVAFVSRRNDHRASARRRLFVARWVEDP